MDDSFFSQPSGARSILAESDGWVDYRSPSYSSLVLADAPLSYWRLDDSGATAVDLMSQSNGAIGAGVIKQVPGVAPGNTAMSFANSGEITVADAGGRFNFVGTAAFSVECWALPLSISTTNWPRIWYRGQGAPRDEICLLQYKNTGTWGVSRYAAGVGQEITSGSTILPLNQWSHLVATFDGTNIAIYQNGTIVGGPTVNTVSINVLNVSAFIGSTGGSSFWNGSLDEVAVYNFALSPRRIALHAQAAKNRPRNQ